MVVPIESYKDNELFKTWSSCSDYTQWNPVTTCSEILSHNEPKSLTGMLQTLLLLPSSGIMM